MLRTDRATIEVEVKWSDLGEAATVGAVVLTLRDVTERHGHVRWSGVSTATR